MPSKKEKINALSKEIWEKKQALKKLRLEAEAEQVKDYSFTDWHGKTIKLSELFGDKQDLILVHNMGVGCAYCTMWADGFVSSLAHLKDRTAFVVSSPDDPKTQQAFAKSRNWTFEMVSAKRNFIQDMGFYDGEQMHPGVSAFYKDDHIYRTHNDVFGPYDDYNPLWNLFTLLKDGSKNWTPKYSYDSHA